MRYRKGVSGNAATQFKKGNPGGPGRPKGTRSLSQHIQAMLEDPEFIISFLDRKTARQVDYKGRPIKAIIRAAIIRAMSGDMRAFDMLAKHGYGDWKIHEIENTPIQQILEKYGLDNAEESPDGGEKKTVRKTETTKEAPPKKSV